MVAFTIVVLDGGPVCLVSVAQALTVHQTHKQTRIPVIAVQTGA